jgi:phosphinothricin acetyltransferase
MAGRSIRPMVASDWPAVARIYAEGIEGGDATFEASVPGWPEWDAAHLESCRLVFDREGEVVAWAALSPVSKRAVYRGVAEVSIYVGSEARGEGVGSQLLAALIEASESAGFWTLQTAIFPENQASIALHTRNGFRVVGTRERVGAQGERWRDTVFLERRSQSVGMPTD